MTPPPVPRFDEAGYDEAPTTPPGLPLWLKVFAIVLAILVVALVVVMLFAGGDHGPGRHASVDKLGQAPGRLVVGLDTHTEPQRDLR